jgi:mRNA interferase MazF
MTTCSCGDVVLVEFQFTDRPVAKNRPALVVSSNAYHASRREVIIAAITSRIRDPMLTGDHLIGQWKQCGLPKPSVVTGIIRTVKASMIGRTLGVMPKDDLNGYRRVLGQALGL